jgi:ABC-type multidrug transport system ATPase subunit
VTLLEARGVRRRFGARLVVDDVSLTMAGGQIVGLVGHNGAGKSTLMRMLAARLLPSDGQVRVGGVDPGVDPDGARRQLGIVPEEPDLWEYLTARETMELVVEVRGTGSVDDALAIADLGPDADRPVRTYSQGMRRKTAIAAAMAAQPRILVLDEALNGLDPAASLRIRGLLRAHADAGGLVLLSTHVLETLEGWADRVLVMKAGRIVADVPGGDDLRGYFA